MELAFKVVEVTSSGDRIIATAENLAVARAAFDTAVSLWPGSTIELRQKARVIAKSSWCNGVLVTRGSVVVEPDTVLRLKRREQKEHVLRRARELAESGRFDGWQAIEFQLRFFDGFLKARTWITGPLRKELNSLCRNARIRKSRSFLRMTAE
jgi:hypothetical protein